MGWKMDSLTAGEAIATIKEILKDVKPEEKDKTIKRLLAELESYKTADDGDHEEEDDDDKEGDEAGEDEEQDDEDEDEGDEGDDILDQIVDTLRKKFPLENNSSVDKKGETLSSGVDEHAEDDMFRGCTDKDTIAVDAFLYDEDVIDLDDDTRRPRKTQRKPDASEKKKKNGSSNDSSSKPDKKAASRKSRK